MADKKEETAIRVIGFSKTLKKLSKSQFKTWFIKRYKSEEKDFEKHYEKLHAPVKEETK